MPTCVIAVTTPRSQLPDDFLLSTSKMIAAQLGKPESYVTVRVETDQLMSHGGTTEPCGSVMLYSIGALGRNNPSHAKKIAEHIATALKIDTNRFYTTFVEIKASDCALGKNVFG